MKIDGFRALALCFFSLASSDTAQLLQSYSRPGGGIPTSGTSGTTGAVSTVGLHPHLHFGRAQKELVRGISDTARRDTIAYRTWAIEKYSFRQHHEN